MKRDFRKLKQLRECKKLTLNQVASAVHISDSYLCRIENNLRLNPSIEILVSLADYYVVPVDELICIKKQEQEEQEI